MVGAVGAAGKHAASVASGRYPGRPSTSWHPAPVHSPGPAQTQLPLSSTVPTLQKVPPSHNARHVDCTVSPIIGSLQSTFVKREHEGSSAVPAPSPSMKPPPSVRAVAIAVVVGVVGAAGKHSASVASGQYHGRPSTSWHPAPVHIPGPAQTQLPLSSTVPTLQNVPLSSPSMSMLSLPLPLLSKSCSAPSAARKGVAVVGGESGEWRERTNKEQTGG